MLRKRRPTERRIVEIRAAGSIRRLYRQVACFQVADLRQRQTWCLTGDVFAATAGRNEGFVSHLGV